MQPKAPRLIQSVFAFAGAGLMTPLHVTPRLFYRVPPRMNSQLIYMRAGNSCGELIYLSVTRDRRPMRLFPIGAKSAIHVTLAMSEDMPPQTELEILVAAPVNVAGFLVLDMGLAEAQNAVPEQRCDELVDDEVQT